MVSMDLQNEEQIKAVFLRQIERERPGERKEAESLSWLGRGVCQNSSTRDRPE